MKQGSLHTHGFLRLLTEWAVAVISIHPILTGAAVKTGVTLTVIDDGIARFAWVHRTTQIKMDEVTDDTGEPAGNPGAHGPFITSQLQSTLKNDNKLLSLKNDNKCSSELI